MEPHDAQDHPTDTILRGSNASVALAPEPPAHPAGGPRKLIPAPRAGRRVLAVGVRSLRRARGEGDQSAAAEVPAAPARGQVAKSSAARPEPVLPRGGHEGVRRPFQDTLSPRKASTIEWCILETVQDEEQAFLAKAKCISVAMDERRDRLLVTYAACQGTAVRSGVLAQLRCPGRSAAMTAACVAAAARRLCTIRKPHPHMNKTRKAATIDSTTLQHILDHVEMFSADGVANEQVAGRLLHPLVQRASGKAAKLNNLKMVLRDKAHACRRLLSRTVVVDPELKAINDSMIFGTLPIAKMRSSLGRPERRTGVLHSSLGRPERRTGVLHSSLRRPERRTGVICSSCGAPNVERSVLRSSLGAPNVERGALRSTFVFGHSQMHSQILEARRRRVARHI